MSTAALWTCVLVVLLAAVFDFRTRHIPNTVSLGGLFVGLCIHGALGAVGGGIFGALKGLGFSLAGAFACGLIPFISWRRKELGGGDVKLFAAIGAIVGPALGFNVQAFTFLIALVVLTPYRIVRHGLARVEMTNAWIAVTNLFRPRADKRPLLEKPTRPPVVLAPTIGVALLVVLFQHGFFE
jgi:prepilin peptidase CpaA